MVKNLMGYTTSCKNSFKWPVKDDILHYDTPQILAWIQEPAPKTWPWRTFVADVNLEIKIPGTVLNKTFLIFQIFCVIILLKMKYSKKKHSSKNNAKSKDFTVPKSTSSRFFCQSNFELKEF